MNYREKAKFWKRRHIGRKGKHVTYTETGFFFLSKRRSIPVTKAFCNCPLNPVFQGPIVFAALLLQRMHMAEATTIKIIKIENPIISFHECPDFPPLG